MFLNRLTVSLVREERVKFSAPEIKFMKGASHHLEEMVFSFLPAKVNVGGYGFFHIYLSEKKGDENRLKCYGQILEYEYRAKDFELNSFERLSSNERYFYLLDVLEEVVNILKGDFELDADVICQTIGQCRENGPSLERVLKISRTHRSKRVKVEIVYVLEAEVERLLCRLKGKKGELLEEIKINPDYKYPSLGYTFRKSKWIENEFVALDRIDQVDFSIDIGKYLNQK